MKFLLNDLFSFPCSLSDFPLMLNFGFPATLAGYRHPLIITLETELRRSRTRDFAVLFAAWAALTPSLLLEKDVPWLLIVGYSEIKWYCTHQRTTTIIRTTTTMMRMRMHARLLLSARLASMPIKSASQLGGSKDDHPPRGGQK